MSHTKEPWFFSSYLKDSGSWKVYSEKPVHGSAGAICAIPASKFHDEKENARRIVACVNACAGISTSDLERVKDEVTPVFELLLKATEQRDKLLDALTGAIVQIEYMHRKFQETGSGNGLIAKLEQLVAEVESTK